MMQKGVKKIDESTSVDFEYPAPRNRDAPKKAIPIPSFNKFYSQRDNIFITRAYNVDNC